MKTDLNRCPPQPIQNFEKMPDYWEGREAFHKKEKRRTKRVVFFVLVLIITFVEILVILIL